MKKYTISETTPLVVNEPALAINRPQPFKISNATKGIGNSTIEYIKYARTGILKKNFDELATYLDISLEQMAKIVGVSYRTFYRKQDDEILDSLKSSRLLEVTDFSTRAVGILGSLEAYRLWLKTPLMALDFETPLTFLDSSFGIKILDSVLGRLVYGVYS